MTFMVYWLQWKYQDMNIIGFLNFYKGYFSSVKNEDNVE